MTEQQKKYIMKSHKKQLSDHELSEKNRPTYFNWLKNHPRHLRKLLLTFIGIATSISLTHVVFDPANDVPIIIAIISMISIFGFTIGITIQPYTIYMKLKKMNFWKNDKYSKKEK